MNRIGLFAPAFAALVVACSSTPPPESPQLVAAHVEYNRAAKGPAVANAQSSLRIANESLNRAQRANNIQDEYATDFAELARSRAELADREGRTVVASRELSTAQRSLIAAQTAQLRAVSQRLGATELQGSGQQVAVISGGLLFKTNSAELQPGVKRQLDEVANVLASEPKVSSVIIDGYTDDTGAPHINDPLSEKRATAVAEYLESRGISRDRFATRGLSTGNPVASNKTVEGRAMNRRVEIQVNAAAMPAPAAPALEQRK